MNRDIRVVQNEKALGNAEYVKLFDMMIKSMGVVELIINSMEETPLTNEEKTDCEGMTVDEIKSLRFIDELTSFNMRELNYVMRGVGDGLYFSKRMNILFMNTLEELKFELLKIQDKVNYSLDINFKTEHLIELKDIYKNINYCVLNGFGLFTLEETNEIQAAVMEYSIKTNTDIKELTKKMVDYYRLNRPSMPLFSKYPELLESLEDSIPDEFFFDIVDLSSFIKKDELQDIVNGSLEITEDYIDLLDYRMNGGKDGDDDF